MPLKRIRLGEACGAVSIAPVATEHCMANGSVRVDLSRCVRMDGSWLIAHGKRCVRLVVPAYFAAFDKTVASARTSTHSRAASVQVRSRILKKPAC